MDKPRDSTRLTPPFGGKDSRKRPQKGTEAKPSTRHFYFAEKPTSLLCVDTEPVSQFVSLSRRLPDAGLAGGIGGGGTAPAGRFRLGWKHKLCIITEMPRRSILAVTTVTQMFVKLLVTGILVFLAGVCLFEVWRLWFDRSLALVQFTYTRDGQVVADAGRAFTQGLDYDLKRIQRLFQQRAVERREETKTPPGGRQPVPEVPFLPGFLDDPIDLRVVKSLAADVKLEAYGLNITAILQSLSRWVRRPAEISGSITQRGTEHDIFAELRGTGVTAHQWELPRELDVASARFSVACRIFRYLAVEHSDYLRNVHDTDFHVFVRAFQQYRLYLSAKREVDMERAEQALEEAERLVDALVQRETQIPHVFGLAGFIYAVHQRSEEAVPVLEQYLAMLEAGGDSDPTAQRLLEGLLNLQRAVVTRAQPRVRPVQPGTSVGVADGSVGTICCIVEGVDGKRYLLSADHVFEGDAGLMRGAVILQPGPLDGGQMSDQVARLSRAVTPRVGSETRASGALAEIDAGVEVNPEVLGFGEITGVATAVQPGDKVVMFGRSGRAEAEIRLIELDTRIWFPDGEVEFTDLIAITPVSRPGDSGAPILTEDGRLVGMVFASSETETIVMPIQPVLDALNVKLAGLDGTDGANQARR